MDWRKRPWNIHFSTDVLGSKLPIEPIQIIPVGGRGNKLNITKDVLTFPNMQPNKLQGCGRGRRLNDSKMIISPVGMKVPAEHLEDIKDLSLRKEKQMKLEKLKDDTEWPSLSVTAQSIEKKEVLSSKKKKKGQLLYATNSNRTNMK